MYIIKILRDVYIFFDRWRNEIDEYNIVIPLNGRFDHLFRLFINLNNIMFRMTRHILRITNKSFVDDKIQSLT